MSSTTLTAPQVGDHVGIDHPHYPGVWVIQSIGPKNVVAVPEAGGRPLRAPKSMVTSAPQPGVTVTAVPLPAYTPFYPGEIVRIATGKFAGTYVVIADKGTKVNVALLGGDGGRYVRALRSSLTKLDPKEVLA